MSVKVASDQEVLREAEQDELLRLGEQVEKIEAKRIENLAQLANLRQISIAAVMRDLKPPTE